MYIKKITTLLLALGLMAGFLSGCAKSDEEKAKEAVEDSAKAAEETAEGMKEAIN